MTSVELLKYQIDSVGPMILRALEGLDEAPRQSSSCPSAMDLETQLTHLAEAYQATIVGAEGGKHDWGSFRLTGSTLKEMIDEMKELREKAINCVLQDSEDAVKMGADYIVGHDNYHLGQLVTLHLSVDPTWNSYAIYG